MAATSEASKGVWTLDIVKVDEVVVKITLIANSNPNPNANANPNPNPNICSQWIHYYLSIKAQASQPKMETNAWSEEQKEELR